jgi:hypothetical protein
MEGRQPRADTADAAVRSGAGTARIGGRGLRSRSARGDAGSPRSTIRGRRPHTTIAALAHARTVAAIELGAAVENPSLLIDGRLVSNGNFHGAPRGFAVDFLAIAAAEVGSISERRVDPLLDATRSEGPPPFLAQHPGVHSGLMIAQYTAAALVRNGAVVEAAERVVALA